MRPHALKKSNYSLVNKILADPLQMRATNLATSIEKPDLIGYTFNEHIFVSWPELEGWRGRYVGLNEVGSCNNNSSSHLLLTFYSK